MSNLLKYISIILLILCLPFTKGYASQLHINSPTSSTETILPVFDLVFPNDNYVVRSAEQEFRWNISENAVRYKIQFSTDNFTTILQEIDNITERYVTVNFENNIEQQWRVIAYDDENTEKISDVRTIKFNIETLDVSEISGLQLWLRADSVAKDENDKVSRWYDLSPNNYEILQSNTTNQPTYISEGLNERPVIRFNGSSSYLNGGDILDLGTESWNIFIVGKGSSYAVSKSIYGSANSRYAVQLNKMQYIDNLQRTVTYIGSEPINSLYELYSVNINRDSSSNYLYYNGELIGTQPISSTYNMNSSFYFLVGGYNSSNGTIPPRLYFNGDLAEILMISGELSDEQSGSVHNYLAQKYFPLPPVNLGYDIHVPNFCDTAITTAYSENYREYLWSTGETDSVIRVNRSGEYSVTVTDIYGATSSDEIRVFFPEPAMISDDTICIGDSKLWNTKLSEDLYSFEWYNHESTSSVVELTNEGEYAVKITDLVGCSYYTDTISIVVDRYEETASLGNDTSLCIGNRIGLVTNSEETLNYLWSDGSTNRDIYPAVSGVYSVTVTNSRGCEARDSIEIDILGRSPSIGFEIENLCFSDITRILDTTYSESGLSEVVWQIDGDTIEVVGRELDTIFANVGLYEFHLTAVANNTCVSDTAFEIEIKEIPEVRYSYTPVCNSVEMRFESDVIIPEGKSVDYYKWKINGEEVSDIENLDYNFTESGEYELAYEVGLNNGCKSEYSEVIEVRDNYSTPEYISCVYPNDNMIIRDSIVNFQWNINEDVFRSKLLISTDTLFNDIVYSAETNQNHLEIDIMNFSDTLYWKIRTYNHCMDSLDFEYREFYKSGNVSLDISVIEGLQLWLRADSVETDSLNRVSQWYDLSSNNYEILQSNTTNQPTYISEGLNEQPVIRFNGSSSYLSGGDILDLGTESWNIFIVGKGSSYAVSKSKYAAANSRYALSFNNMVYVDSIQRSVTFIGGQPSNSLYELYSVRVNRDSSKNYLYYNGGLIGTLPINSEFNMNSEFDFIIGGYNNNAGTVPPPASYYFSGDLAEILMISGELSDEQSGSVHNYLGQKYFPLPPVNLGYNIHVPNFCDTAITTAYSENYREYLWSTGETDSIIRVNRSGEYSVTVTDVFGVTSSDEIMVFFPKHNQMQDTTICAGDTAYWNLGLPEDDYSFEWFKDGERYTPPTEANSRAGYDRRPTEKIPIFEEGAYNCVITDNSGCSFVTDTMHLTIDNYEFTAGFGNTDTTLCKGNRLRLLSGHAETIAYQWNNGATDLELYLTESGTYSATTTNFRGCQSTNTINVTIRGQVPEPMFSIQGHCQNAPISLSDQSVSPVGNIVARKWYANEVFIGNSANINHIFQEYGEQSFSLYIENDDNCFNDTTISLYVHSQPLPDFIPKTFCQNTIVEVYAVSTIPEDTISSHSWEINGNVLNGDTISAMFENYGVDTVFLTATSIYGCEGTEPIVVDVYNATMPIIGFSGVCYGMPTTFTDSTPTFSFNLPVSRLWNFGDNENSYLQNAVHNYDTTGIYEISYTINYTNHCSATIYDTVQIFSNPEVEILTENLCAGVETQIETNINSDFEIENYEWTIGQDTIFADSVINTTIDTVGKLPISLKIIDINNCQSETADSLMVNAVPSVSFFQSRTWGSYPLNVDFTNSSQGASSYLWDFGDSNSSSDENPSYTFTEIGTYEVKLTATNEYGCFDSYTSPIISVLEPIVDVMLMNLNVDIKNSFATISLLVVNYGAMPVSDVLLELTIDGSHYREIIPYLAPGEVRQHTFGTQIPVSALSTNISGFTACVTAVVPDVDGIADRDLANNTLCYSKAENLSATTPYPNPTNDKIYCEIHTQKPTDVVVSIYNPLGEMVATDTYSAHKGNMTYSHNVAQWASGLYYIRISADEQSVVYKFEVQ